MLKVPAVGPPGAYTIKDVPMADRMKAREFAAGRAEGMGLQARNADVPTMHVFGALV